MKKTICKLCLTLVGLAAISMPSALRAQTSTGATPAPADAAATQSTPASTPGAKPDASMDTIVVNAVPIEENIMPTSRPSNSVYGLDMSVLDTPRSATIISREQLSVIDITDARDYSKLTSDAYTESDFGTPTQPAIRGQPADIFINGQRIGINADGNGPPVDFNSIESVNIIKGPPDAVYGSSVFVGGYIDQITKRPYFDKFQGDIEATFGMYDQYRQTLDFGGPITKDLAYRISYSGSESGSYYDFVHNDSQYLYGALDWVPSDNYSFQFNNEFGEIDYLENNGINRVTQALIDNGSYIQGQASNPLGYFPSGFYNNVPYGGTVDISRNLNIRNPNDGAYAKTYNAQAKQTFTINDDLKIVDSTLVTYIWWRTYNSQFYDQLSNGDVTAQNRLEVQYSSDIPIIGATKATPSGDPKDMKAITMKGDADPGLTFHNQFNAGVDFHFAANDDAETIASEPFNAFDITQDPITVHNEIPPSAYAALGVAHIPGLPDKYLFDVGSNDSGKSYSYQTGFFIQDVLKFTDQWSILFGARADILHIDASPFEGTPSADYFSDSTTQVMPNYNVSPTFKPTEWSTLYFTYNHSVSPLGTGQSGVYSPYGGLAESNFHQEDELFEFGAKFTLLKDKLYATATVYHEDRAEPTSTATSYRQRVNGAEFELNYQPDKHFYATASYSWFDGHDIDPGFQYNTVPTDKTIAGGTVTTDIIGFATGSYKSPGFPTNSFNFLAVYKFDFGLGLSVDMQVTSPIDVSWLGGVQIPWQYNLDFSAFYTYKNATAKLSIYNATDEKNWGTVNPIYGLDSIFAEEPIHIEGTIKYHF